MDMRRCEPCETLWKNNIWNTCQAVLQCCSVQPLMTGRMRRQNRCVTWMHIDGILYDVVHVALMFALSSGSIVRQSLSLSSPWKARNEPALLDDLSHFVVIERSLVSRHVTEEVLAVRTVKRCLGQKLCSHVRCMHRCWAFSTSRLETRAVALGFFKQPKATTSNDFLCQVASFQVHFWLTGLAASRMYYVQVAAKTACGQGEQLFIQIPSEECWGFVQVCSIFSLKERGHLSFFLKWILN